MLESFRLSFIEAKWEEAGNLFRKCILLVLISMGLFPAVVAMTTNFRSFIFLLYTNTNIYNQLQKNK